MAQTELTTSNPADGQIRPRKADGNAKFERPAGTHLKSTVLNRPFNAIYFPIDTAFRQQRLKAWQSVFDPTASPNT
jgi:Cell cycle control protein